MYRFVRKLYLSDPGREKCRQSEKRYFAIAEVWVACVEVCVTEVAESAKLDGF